VSDRFTARRHGDPPLTVAALLHAEHPLAGAWLPLSLFVDCGDRPECEALCTCEEPEKRP
jgi:hypothetical protein